MYTLSAFNSIFELSVGVHLEFSLFEELQGRVLREYARTHGRMVKKHEALSPRAKSLLRHNVDDVGHGLHFAETAMEDLSVIFRRVAFVIASYSGGVLLVAGFNPSLQVPGWLMGLMLFVAISPAALMILASHYAAKRMVIGMGPVIDECYSDLNSAAFHDQEGSLDLWEKLQAELVERERAIAKMGPPDQAERMH